MDMTNWTHQQKLAYYVGKLSMADEVIAALRQRNKGAGIVSAELNRAEAARAEVIKQIEALAGLNEPEIYACHRSKPHRALYPIRSSELRIDQLLEYPVKTFVYFDGSEVLLLSRHPLCFSDIRFLIWDIREMRCVPMYLSYVQVLNSFMKSYFGDTTQWALRPGVDALRSTYEYRIESDAAFFEKFGVRL